MSRFVYSLAVHPDGTPFLVGAFPPPLARDCQIKFTKGGRLAVRCRHGWELADSYPFALRLWAAAWSHNSEVQR